MTVRDLQECLNAYPPEAEIRVSGLYGSKDEIRAIDEKVEPIVCNLGHEHGEKIVVWLQTDLFTE